MLTVYSKETTSFSTLGIGVLKDFLSNPLITEELNGAYTLEFQYAKDGYLSEYLIEQNIIKANGQPFRIWNVKKDMQKITILAKHVFFDLSFNFLSDVYPKNLTAQSALEWLLNRAAVSTNFSVTGNCTAIASGRYVRKTFIDAIFNEDNALLKRFGGELSYDNFNITVHEQRGSNANFSIRYKKNLTGIDFNLDFSNVATRIVPIGFDGLTIDSTYVESPKVNNYFTPLYKTYEFSDIKYDPDDEEAYHTLAEAKQALINAANELFTKNVDLPQISIGVNFVELSKCTEYASYSNLETVHLGDTIDVIIPELNIHTSARVNKTVYDCILERFITLEIGSAKQSVTRSQINVENQIRKSENYLTQAQQNAENLINHPFNGNVYIDKENGVIYLMDSTSPETAQNVWKWSLGGLGFSSTGINGTYTVAILQDGRINADFITTGQLDTGVIQGYDSLLIQVDTLDREFQNEINPTYTACGSSITLEDSAETELIDFELEGKAEQAARSGKNLLKNTNTNSGDYNFWDRYSTFDETTRTLTRSTTETTESYILHRLNGLKSNTTYTLSLYAKSNGYVSSMDLFCYNQNTQGVKSKSNIVLTTDFQKYTFTFTTASDVTYGANSQIRIDNNGSTTSGTEATLTIKDVMLVEGTDTEYEDYGIQPSPDYPSKLVNVGYENLFDKDNANVINAYLSGSMKIVGANDDRVVFIPCKPNTKYYVTKMVQATTASNRFSLGTTATLPQANTTLVDFVYFPNGTTETTFSITTGNTAKYLVCGIYHIDNSTTFDEMKNSIQIEEGTQQHSYIPYGKYGIEVKTTGKNLFDSELGTTSIGGVTLTYNDDKTITINGTATSNATAYAFSKYPSGTTFMKLQPNKKYSASVSVISGSMTLGSNTEHSSVQFWQPWDYSFQLFFNNIANNKVYVTKTPTASIDLNRIQIAIRQGDIFDNFKIGIQFEEGDLTNYEEYKLNTYQYILDAPLRSISNIKDLLYIKNGMLYVERNIGSVVLDGTESDWGVNGSSHVLYRPISNKKQAKSGLLSNYYKYTANDWSQAENNTISEQQNNNYIFIKNNDFSSVNNFKTWLGTHNTEVQYILAEPYIEELGSVDMPSTYKGITYLNTTDELEPKINITYVRDTIIANYVESHVREIKITEKGIESRVQTIEESDYGEQISAVEERTTSTEKNIEVISTNIDTTTGEVRKVTTTNGMTFDENGLNIHTNQSTFNAQHTYQGTYYRDGEEVITETTINGFKATNLKNKGQHEYSYDDTHDLYEFIDERIEVDGEYCYATFYNGEE